MQPWPKSRNVFEVISWILIWHLFAIFTQHVLLDQLLNNGINLTLPVSAANYSVVEFLASTFTKGWQPVEPNICFTDFRITFLLVNFVFYARPLAYSQLSGYRDRRDRCYKDQTQLKRQTWINSCRLIIYVEHRNRA